MTAIEMFNQYKGQLVKYVGTDYASYGLRTGRMFRLIAYHTSELYVGLKAENEAANILTHGSYGGIVEDVPVNGYTRVWWITPDQIKVVPEYTDKIGKRVRTPLGRGKIAEIDEDEVLCVELDSDTEHLYEFNENEVSYIQ